MSYPLWSKTVMTHHCIFTHIDLWSCLYLPLLGKLCNHAAVSEFIHLFDAFIWSSFAAVTVVLMQDWSLLSWIQLKKKFCMFQVVASKTLTRPLQLKKDKPAGKGTITVCTVCVWVQIASMEITELLTYVNWSGMYYICDKMIIRLLWKTCVGDCRGDKGQQSHWIGAGG